MRTSEPPLNGETIIFTGTPRATDVFSLVEEYGGTPVSLPLIQVAELVESTDQLRLEACATYDWLIFTSQSAVAAFKEKLERFNVSVETIPSHIAAIGSRTAAALEKLGFTVEFIPTVFSADVFVKQFQPAENEARRLLFLRGSIAGPTIREELPFEVDEWTIYKTERVTDNAGKLVQLLKETEKTSVLFASPSAVEVFAEEVVPVVGWKGYTIGAIGHITEKALEKVGANVHVRPNTYTLKDLVDKLASRKDV
ncbi:uroporphyrinogen-III synthase [Sporosarcina pasteurii]|uniref:Uroporphyrinogen-III synthase n=1 Tax=Sporosarcina pasteurii TaxID=1474 RepID=A0A380BVY2_SPOPA|nr:uroporphyrinogen-III synthase [Sporosarcina pasteurii]MDS9471359.1 uroporphyrinogen-III synthase [Sporosarcina pasteurii]QBQ05013.1 uroporphyrinogen-III synthase [Sporosarcina pasteurii]SUJ08020.1 uroporphyrinogen-III synthase [Sporosarcina pasteurii]